MRRSTFIKIAGITLTGLIIEPAMAMAQQQHNPRSLFFKDDGVIPNSQYALLLYHNVFTERGAAGATWLETHFAANGWTNSWRWGVYPFHHYHSNTHEVLGVFSGQALLHLGGEQGEKVEVLAGDIIVIPAGVGHKCLTHSNDFTVVGAYPDGLQPDLNRGEKGERPQTDRNIAAVALPRTDPLLGKNEGLCKFMDSLTCYRVGSNFTAGAHCTKTKQQL
jgi:uncharacterized protein YjlB